MINMAVAPIVEYYRLEGSTGQYQFVDANNPSTQLDFGTVDAGTSTHEGTITNITSSLAGCQVFAIFNNKGAAGGAVSDMQNAVLSVVDDTGSSAGKVYEGRWINVVLNDGDENNPVKLGKYKATADHPADTEEFKLDLTAIELDPENDKGTIKGTANGGTLADTDNYAQIKVWVDIQANADAGPHLFRLRTTYSYT
jgi:hypothetical protein